MRCHEGANDGLSRSGRNARSQGICGPARQAKVSCCRGRNRSFLSPDAAERQEATLARRLDRITRQIERLERDVGISAETVALFIRFWLIATPSLPEQAQPAARAKGQERYENFLQALGRRLAKGPGFVQEVSLDIKTRGALGPSQEEVPDRS